LLEQYFFYFSKLAAIREKPCVLDVRVFWLPEGFVESHHHEVGDFKLFLHKEDKLLVVVSDLRWQVLLADFEEPLSSDVWSAGTVHVA